jgi:thiamine biosynthesis protein ThiI
MWIWYIWICGFLGLKTFLSYNHNPTAMSLFLIRYGELGLKSPKVRRRFEKALKTNIEDAFLQEGIQCITGMDWGRIYLHCESDSKAKKILKRIVGITSVSPVLECSSKMEDICKCASEYSESLLKKGSSFAVRASRTGEHDFTSQDVAREVGSAILEANNKKDISVDLKNPDIEIFVEVRHNRGFVFSEKIQGPGGFPKGTQGKVLCLITDRKSVYAAWLLLKRGCNIRSFYVDENGEKMSKALKSWYVNSKPTLARDPENPVENALDYAKSIKADAVVLGYTFQDYLKKDNITSELPIFYPLIGMDDKEIEKKLTSLFGADF